MFGRTKAQEPFDSTCVEHLNCEFVPSCCGESRRSFAPDSIDGCCRGEIEITLQKIPHEEASAVFSVSAMNQYRRTARDVRNDKVIPDGQVLKADLEITGSRWCISGERRALVRNSKRLEVFRMHQIALIDGQHRADPACKQLSRIPGIVIGPTSTAEQRGQYPEHVFQADVLQPNSE